MMRLGVIDKEELAIKCGSVKCVPNVRENGFEVIISYRFRGWWLNIQWFSTNLIGLARVEVEQIKGFAQCNYNLYYAKSVVSTI